MRPNPTQLYPPSFGFQNRGTICLPVGEVSEGSTHTPREQAQLRALLHPLEMWTAGGTRGKRRRRGCSGPEAEGFPMGEEHEQ